MLIFLWQNRRTVTNRRSEAHFFKTQEGYLLVRSPYSSLKREVLFETCDKRIQEKESRNLPLWNEKKRENRKVRLYQLDRQL